MHKKQVSYNKYIDIIRQFEVFIVKDNNNKYKIELVKRPNGPKPPKPPKNPQPSLRKLIMDLKKTVEEDHKLLIKTSNLLDNVIKLNNLKID